MRLLIIDAGNSRVRAALATGAAAEQPAAVVAAGAGVASPLREVLAVPTPADDASVAEMDDRLRALNDRANCDAAVLVSVVPRLDPILAAALPGLRRLDHRSAWSFPLAVAEPATVGADRLCNVAAAVAAGWRNALVIDAGTATTFDVLRDGAFAGGLIAPGMALAAAALTATAARLAPQPFTAIPLAVARDTATAIRAGCYHVGRNGVLATAGQLRAELGDPPVVFTGGLGQLLAGPQDLYDPAWTLRGAAWVFARAAPAS